MAQEGMEDEVGLAHPRGVGQQDPVTGFPIFVLLADQAGDVDTAHSGTSVTKKM